ncbi:MAG: SDR family NAD(P)-dependent oxidoreductase [Thalassolituus maritimus]|uniref:sulfoacetaldehyde reductase (NADPH) n=1 Tax=Thalassolituus maritimus TaxID=484498 RepID=A0A1N7IYC8_9GAMM|nr:SDR family NAD(P)-dependent oxidoreductase [Thalassolituus maritimus]TPD54906.1 MAG: SDR family NAD(P)-dependent oxidoreductase [Thalassolituus maritimus]SIS42103.1 NADP-dependent 3-hydroxy acid dehydrogenase YdfG [Thalassolituus maritimus]
MDNIVLITGASSGFGEECARVFAKQGSYRLILASRRLDLLDKLASELRPMCDVHISELDVSSTTSVDKFLTDLPEKYRDIDIFINSAGLALGLDPTQNSNFEDWNVMIQTNVMGMLRLTHAILPRMVERNKGHIVSLGSTAGNWPYPGGNVYGATKSFIQSFARGLKSDLLGTNVRITNIDPGLSKTNFSLTRFKGDAVRADSLYENKKPLLAEDVASIICWVCSLPSHVNINNIEVMPVCQAFAGLSVSSS